MESPRCQVIPEIIAIPSTLGEGDLRLELVSFAPHRIHKVPTYHFLMRHAITGEELGAINLRVASTPHIERYAGHIGYSVHADHRGRRYACRALRLLLPVARSLGIDPLWVTCDPENAASRRTLELAGGVLVEEVDVPADCVIHQSGHPRKSRYRL
jgi:tagatose 1,6-diphosphate aldolase